MNAVTGMYRSHGARLGRRLGGGAMALCACSFQGVTQNNPDAHDPDGASLPDATDAVMVSLLPDLVVEGAAVTPPAPANLATAGTATQSSTAYSGVASRANDGNTNGDYFQAASVTHTNSEAQPWWEVALPHAATLESVALFNRTDCCGNRLTNFSVTVTELGAPTFTQDFFPPGDGGFPNPTLSVPLPAGTSADVVQVQLLGSNPLSLAEVQAIGVFDDSVAGLSWSLVNRGDEAAAPCSVHIAITEVTSGLEVFSQTVEQTTALPAASSVAMSVPFAASSSGSYRATITADASATVSEGNIDGDAEGNNTVEFEFAAYVVP
jgi:hypothetical protein